MTQDKLLKLIYQH